jgi:L-fuculose-phosphate aldolase
LHRAWVDEAGGGASSRSLAMTKTENELRQDIVEIGRYLHRFGFVAANDGNITARLDDQRILATPTGVSKGRMAPDDLVIIDYEGKKISGRSGVTSEIAMHLLIYKHRPAINAIVHAHPATATGYAAAGLSLNQAIISEIVYSLGCIPLAPYGMPGTPDLLQAIEPLVGSYDALLLANHGVVTYAPDVWGAYFKMETVEHFAKISLVTVLLGQQKLLSDAEVDRLMTLRSRFFGPDAIPIPRSSTCPVTGETCGSLERISVSRQELEALVAEAVQNLKGRS